MRANDKIYVSEYLKELNERVKDAITYGNLDKNSVKSITCKELAKLCNVTPATISNLSTCSNFYLLYRISVEILNAYFDFFIYEESIEKAEHPHETIYTRYMSYILMTLTRYYTGEFLNK